MTKPQPEQSRALRDEVHVTGNFLGVEIRNQGRAEVPRDEMEANGAMMKGLAKDLDTAINSEHREALMKVAGDYLSGLGYQLKVTEADLKRRS